MDLYRKIVKLPTSEKEELQILAIKRGYSSVLAFISALISREIKAAKKSKEL